MSSLDRIAAARVVVRSGRITGATGSVLRARLPGAAIGEVCELLDADGAPRLRAEVIGFRDGEVVLVPIGDLAGLPMDAEVRATGAPRSGAVGDALLGRVIDAAGRPLDGAPAAVGLVDRPLHRAPPAPLERALIDTPLPTGVRAIDGLLTCARGQRVGIFGEPGGGKSTLLGALVRGTACDVCVVCLVGERGREVREFLERTLGPDALARSVVVVATSDRPAIERTSAADLATCVAEWFRDQGKDVLLVLDSLTRFARAEREIALNAGELPARRGFPNSVLARLPGLLERAGPAASGSITAFYTVLVEGDGTGDPVAEEVRSILDGHVVLSAELAARAHYPAIDVLRSRSRLADAVVAPDHRRDAVEFTSLWAKHEEIAFLLQVGEYRAGQDPRADRAVERHDAMEAFLRQDDRPVAFAEMRGALRAAVGAGS